MACGLFCQEAIRLRLNTKIKKGRAKARPFLFTEVFKSLSEKVFLLRRLFFDLSLLGRQPAPPEVMIEGLLCPVQQSFDREAFACRGRFVKARGSHLFLLGLVGSASVTSRPICAFLRSTTCARSLIMATFMFSPPLTETIIFLACPISGTR